MQIRHVLAQAIQTLAAVSIDTPRLDAELLLAHLLQEKREWLIAHDDQELDPVRIRRYQDLVDRRAHSEPLAYLTGRRSFFGHTFHVDPRVLIPRPETELLVEAVLAHATTLPAPLAIADIGTGSGIIAISLAISLLSHAPAQLSPTLFAVDASAAALEVAQRNAARLMADWPPDQAWPITFLHGDLLQPLPGPVDIIAANLPYISETDHAQLQPNVRDHEPAAALLSGPDGLDHIRRLLAQAPAYLHPHGAIFLEIGHDQGPAVADLAARLLPGSHTHITQDLAGHDRLATIT